MNRKILIASGAALLLALGSAFADARPMGGGGGGGFGGGGGPHFGGGGGGPHFGGGGGGGPRFGGGGPRFGGGNFSGRSFRGGPSFGPGRNFGGMRGSRNFAFRGPVNRWNGGKWNGGRWNGGWRHGGRNHHHGRRIFVGAPYFYDYGYYDYGYYGDDCGWLYRRAVSTGSPYWWRRYTLCAAY